MQPPRRDPAPHPRSVLVCTPWYPTRHAPHGGTFVRSMVEAVADGCPELSVHFFDNWVAHLGPGVEERVIAAQDALRPLQPPPPTLPGTGVRYGYHPVPVPAGRDLHRRELTERHAAAMRRAFGGPLPASVVHAHVGLPTGWAALRNLAPGARLFVTEHASFLPAMLADPVLRRMYAELIERCEKFFVVGSRLRDTMAAAFPARAGKVVVVPNPIDFGPGRPEPVRELTRWLYVGRLIEIKAVHLVVEALARCRRADPRLTLTVVGEGAEREALEQRAAALGVAGAVTFAGGRPHAETMALMRGHDLLVHASRAETFGMTLVEAVAAGMPVLVTRCGGPEETLAEVAGVGVEFVDVEETADSLVAGYQRLRGRLPDGLDLPEARRRLAARYSRPAVAAQYHRHWFGAGEPVVPRQRHAAQVEEVR